MALAGADGAEAPVAACGARQTRARVRRAAAVGRAGAQARPFGGGEFGRRPPAGDRPRRRGRGAESNEVALEDGRLVAGEAVERVSALSWAVYDATDGDRGAGHRPPERPRPEQSGRSGLPIKPESVVTGLRGLADALPLLLERIHGVLLER